MKATYFNNFMKVLNDNKQDAERMGYAFMTLTEKQLLKVGNWYYKNDTINIERVESGNIYARLGDSPYSIKLDKLESMPLWLYMLVKKAGYEI